MDEVTQPAPVRKPAGLGRIVQKFREHPEYLWQFYCVVMLAFFLPYAYYTQANFHEIVTYQEYQPYIAALENGSYKMVPNFAMCSSSSDVQFSNVPRFNSTNATLIPGLQTVPT